MKKLYMILAVMAILCVSGQAQTNWVGGDFGVLIQKHAAPQVAYSVTKDFSLKKIPLIGAALSKFALAEGWEGSVLYSSRNTTLTQETYAAKLINYKVFAVAQGPFKGFFAGCGFGTWTMTNTDGADVTYAAGKAGFGWALGPFIARITGDVVGVNGTNLHMISAGALFNL